ncbi:hypothetical protein ACFE04_005045 [Oxalis oulophora]
MMYSSSWFSQETTTGGKSSSSRELDDHQQFTCEICFESISTIRKFHNKNRCRHPHCVDCVSEYIQVNILENKAKIVCPDLKCQHELDPVSSMYLISKTLFSKWCDRLCEDSVLGLDKSYCPNKKCMTMVVNEESKAMTRDENGILLGKLIERNKWQRCPACGHCVHQKRALFVQQSSPMMH